MVRITIISIVSVFALFWVGCQTAELARIDTVADTAVKITEQGEQLIASPLGVLIPPPVAQIIKLAGAAIVAAAMGWQEFRRRTASTAIAEIVRGVEKLKHGGQSGTVSISMNATQGKTTQLLVKKTRLAL